MNRILTLLLTLFFINSSLAQGEPNDCVNAIVVCGNGNFVSNASGIGATQEVSGCSGFEHNSLWIRINIVQSGTLGFDLIPTNPSILIDYDFWVYGPSTNCGALGSPIRCATTNPNLAGMSNNHTGMYASTTLTQTGPGANGNGYVRWLNVVAGQSYYICVDRPVGDGGFQIQWTGSATLGTGAFPSSPSVNAVAPYQTCSSTPNVGIFDLSTISSSINSDIVNNTITYYTTFANAFDGINALPNIIGNTSNPQTIYAKVKNNTSGCYSITNFDLVVNPIPTASMSVSNTTLCSGDSVMVTFNGSPNATIEYTINSGPVQTAVLSNTGVFSFSEIVTTTKTYSLIYAKMYDSGGNIICTQPYNNSIVVTVNPLPTASISGSATICSGTTAIISFSGTPSSTITYTINGGSNQTILLDASGNATLTTPILTANASYNLVSVATNSNPICSQLQSGSALITVNTLPTASISGTTSVCSGQTATISFSGSPNATITYTIDGGSNQTINLDSSGSASVTTSALTSSTTYNLVSVATTTSPICSQVITGSAIVTVVGSLTASISGTTTICSGSNATISFSGTPNTIVTYTINGGANQTIPLNGTGIATINLSNLTSSTTYSLVNVATTTVPVCSQNLLGSAIITVLPVPTASISGTTTICEGNSTLISFSGTPSAIVTYNINGGLNQTITLNSSGNASLITPILTSNSNYNLVSVSIGGTVTCSQLQSGTAVITVNPLPTATISGTATICDGSSTIISFSGTPNAIVSYTINGGSNQTITLDASGNGTLVTPTLSVNTTYSLVNVSSATSPICTSNLSGNAVITIKAIPTATISGTTTICSGASTLISFSGTPNAIVTYTINGGTNQTITLNASGNASLNTSNLSSNSSYSLVSIASGGIPNCSQMLSGTALVTVIAMPTASISGTTTICSGNTTNIVFSGTPNATITYTINGGANQTLNLNATGNFTLVTPSLTSNTVYALVSVATSTVPSCNQTQSGSAIITITPLPTATISGTTTICSGTSSSINFTGTPNGIVTFNANGGSNQTITLDATGNFVWNTPLLNSTTTYNLVSVFLGCSQNLSGSAIITVNQLPNATISGNTTICFGSNTTINFTGTPNATIVYNVDGGVNQSLSLNSSGTASLVTPNLTSNSIYTLVSISSNGIPNCSRLLSNSTTISVVPIPTVVASPATQTICSGQATSIVLSGNIGTGATFSWTVNQNGVTGAINGIGNVITQNLTTTGSTPGTVTYTITPSFGTCIGTSQTVVIIVNPKPNVVASPSSQSICSGTNSLISLTSNVPSTTFSWTIVQNNVTGASNGSGSIINQTLTATGSTTGTVIYSITPTLNGCIGDTVNVTVSVSTIPTVNVDPAQTTICSGQSTNVSLSSLLSGTTFSWSVTQSGVSGAQSGTGNSINQNLVATGIVQGTATYTITPTNNGCVGTAVVLVIMVNPKPNVTASTLVNICSNTSTNINLNSNIAGTTFDWTVVQSGVTGASAGTGVNISQNLTTTSSSGGTVLYSVTPTNNGCTGNTIIITVNVNPLPEFVLNDGVVCLNQAGNPIDSHTFLTGLSDVNYDFQWFFQGNSIPLQNQSLLVANQPGVYGVIATNITTGCVSNLITADLVASIPAQSIQINHSLAFSNSPFVEVIVNGGNGVYQFQLDNGPIQSTNIFSDIMFGDHTIKVTDLLGCTFLTSNFTIIGYPKFFTPNGDGYNDTWNINGLENNNSSIITIFDRYSKLIKQIKPNSNGWDGTFNGQLLPSTDYWFSVDYIENGQNKNFKSHFSLKR